MIRLLLTARDSAEGSQLVLILLGTFFTMKQQEKTGYESSSFANCVAHTAQWAPVQRPTAWLGVNILCALASFIVLAHSLAALDLSAYHPSAEALYFVYSAVTTVLWCLEIGLTVWERRWTEQPLTAITYAELLLAVVFGYDSIALALAWRLNQGDLEVNAWDAGLNALAYLYAAWETSRMLARGARTIATEPYEPVEDVHSEVQEKASAQVV